MASSLSLTLLLLLARSSGTILGSNSSSASDRVVEVQLVEDVECAECVECVECVVDVDDVVDAVEGSADVAVAPRELGCLDWSLDRDLESELESSAAASLVWGEGDGCVPASVSGKM